MSTTDDLPSATERTLTGAILAKVRISRVMGQPMSKEEIHEDFNYMHAIIYRIILDPLCQRLEKSLRNAIRNGSMTKESGNAMLARLDAERQRPALEQLDRDTIKSNLTALMADIDKAIPLAKDGKAASASAAEEE